MFRLINEQKQIISLLLHGKLQTISNNNDKHIFMRVAIAKLLSHFQMHEHVVVIYFHMESEKDRSRQQQHDTKYL